MKDIVRHVGCEGFQDLVRFTALGRFMRSITLSKAVLAKVHKTRWPCTLVGFVHWRHQVHPTRRWSNYIWHQILVYSMTNLHVQLSIVYLVGLLLGNSFLMNFYQR